MGERRSPAPTDNQLARLDRSEIVVPPLLPHHGFERQRVGRFIWRFEEPIRVTAPYELAEYLLEQVFCPFDALDQEELWVFLATLKNDITHEALVYRGTAFSSQMRVSEVFKEAVRYNRPALFIAHNHPSGDPEPSADDLAITKQIQEAGKLLDIKPLDHLIIGDGRWLSMRDRGLGLHWGW